MEVEDWRNHDSPSLLLVLVVVKSSLANSVVVAPCESLVTEKPMEITNDYLINLCYPL